MVKDLFKRRPDSKKQTIDSQRFPSLLEDFLFKIGMRGNPLDAFHLNSTGPFGTPIYFLTKLKYVAL